MITVKDVVDALENRAPSALQESYDNSGLHTGNPHQPVNGILVCLDVIPEVLEEAVSLGCNFIVSHHPPFFSGIKNFTGQGLAQQVLITAIKNDLVLYSAHTNLDSVPDGVSGIMADKLGLTGNRVLVPRIDDLLKLVCYIPTDHLQEVSDALFSAGAGLTGKYDCCSFQAEGVGTFRAGVGANPVTGEIGRLHHEPEIRFETILPRHLSARVVDAMLKAHPYEEVAYDLIPLLNKNHSAGLGIVGELPADLSELQFLQLVKETFNAGMIRHSALSVRPVRRVAVCGGSGSQFISDAWKAGADAYITADIKYHNWFDVPVGMLVADIGHFESEQFAMNILYDTLIEKFPKFAVRLTEVNTNPIKYL